MSSGRSWGHELARMDAEHVASWQRIGWTCSAPRCKNDAAFEATYRYVTGRSGRVSDSTRRLCEPHAERFAAKHGLEVPA